jgi:type II secretory pathway pseudopilin PulG
VPAIPYSYHRMSSAGQRRASLPETVGAWLRLWTPPRDVEVPAVPVRKLLVGTAIALVVVGVGAAILVPRIEGRKDRQATEAAREKAQAQQAARLRAIHEQRPRRQSAAGLRPAPGASEARQVQARVALLGAVQTAITADAKARVQAGEMRGVPSATTCAPYPPRDPDPQHDLSVPRAVYDCLTTVREIKATNTNIGGQLGYPFRAVVDFKGFSYAWCKTNPIPGERVVPDPRTVVELPKACRA